MEYFPSNGVFFPRISRIKGFNTDFFNKGDSTNALCADGFHEAIRAFASNLWNPSAQSAFVESDFFFNLRLCER